MKSSTNDKKDVKDIKKDTYNVDDDDNAVLELSKLDDNEDNDSILEEYENSGLIDQGHQAITYSVKDLYKNKAMTKFRNRHEMKVRPPELHIESSEGDEASFFLTQKLTDHLITLLIDVRNGYAGIQKTHQHVLVRTNNDGMFSSIKKWIQVRLREFLILFVSALGGLLYAGNVPYPAYVLFIIALLMVILPSRDKRGGKDNNENDR